MKLNFRALALAFACLGVAALASAQETEAPPDPGRFRLGPIRFTPSIELTSVGRDSNVFNEADSPRGDTTAAFGPTVQLWMNPGSTRVTGKFSGQYLYFKQYSTQRAWNTSDEAKWEFPLSRIEPFVGGRYINSRERQGYEIDSRSRRRDAGGSIGTNVLFSGKTKVVLSYERQDVSYDKDETFLGAELAQELNRTEQRTNLQFRYAASPLTTFVIRSEIGRDRFTTVSLRDSDSVRVMPGFELKPLALISGEVFVGYRHLSALDARVPDFTGLVAAVKAKYTRDATRFEVKVDRDLAYSYAITRPYYALLDAGLTVTQRLGLSWEIVGRGSRQSLAYRLVSSAAATDPSGVLPGTADNATTDRGHIFGTGVGYRVGEALRLGLDVNYATRRSEIEGRRDFNGLRVFGSIAYGIQQ
jgi:hypothetical protein